VTVGGVHYSLLFANDCDLLFNLLFRTMSSFRGVRPTAVQMPMLRGSRGWLFSVSEAPDAVSRVHVDLARQPYFKVFSALKQSSCLAFNS